MGEIVTPIAATRGAVRAYVTEKASFLEAAQASGRLARAKLDLRDEADTVFAPATTDDKAALRAMLDEEIEALCSDLRLASVTVQAQIERRSRNWGKGILIGIGVAIAALLVCVGVGVDNAGVGFGVPLLAGVIAVFVFA